MNPKLKAALWPLLAALCGALASYFATGCSPTQTEQARSAADAVAAGAELAACLRGAAAPALDHPNELTLAEALAVRAKLQACARAAQPDAADAGAGG